MKSDVFAFVSKCTRCQSIIWNKVWKGDDCNNKEVKKSMPGVEAEVCKLV